MKFNTIAENLNLGTMDWTIPKGMGCGNDVSCFVQNQVLHIGDSISLRACGDKEYTATVRVFRMGWYSGAGARLLHTENSFLIPRKIIWNRNSKPSITSASSLDWPEVMRIPIGNDWCEGLYVLRVELEDGRATIAPFWLTSPDEVEGLTMVFSPINIQARNWWGGNSATQVINGRPKKMRELYYPIGSEELSLNRPMYNSRGGDALRWDYPLIRFLERHDIPLTYSSDLDISSKGEIPESVSHIVTTGPMRYWTAEFDHLVSTFVEKGGEYVHLGSEAGQHIVSIDSDVISFHGPGVGERLTNPLIRVYPSGSKPKPPWSSMKLIADGNQPFSVQGLIGSSWDRSLEGSDVVGFGFGRHRLFRKRIAEAVTRDFGLGRVFNSSVSNWTWALSAYRRQGNIKVDENVQRFTLSLLGLDANLLDTNQDSDMIIDDDLISGLSLVDLEKILEKDPDDFTSLLTSGIRLFEQDRFVEADLKLQRAHELRPRSILATYRLARNHHKLKRYDEMIPLYHELLRQRPDRFHYLQQYGNLLLLMDRFDEGRRAIEKAIKIRPEEPSTYVSLANDARRRGRFEYAMKMLQSALKINPRHKGAQSTIAMMLESQGDYLAARDLWSTLFESDSSNFRAKMGIARCSYRSGDYDTAFPLLKDIISDGILRYIREAGIYSVNIAVNHLEDNEQIIQICTKLLGQYIEVFSSANNGDLVVTQMALAFARQEKFESAMRLVEHHRDFYNSTAEINLLKSQLFLLSGQYPKHLEMVKQSFGFYNSANRKFDSNDSKLRCRVGDLESSISLKVEGPLVSVIMTVYGYNKLVETAIESIQSQTYHNFELIVVDDCSPDGAFEKLNKFTSNDDRIKVLQMNTNRGTYAAKNLAMSVATGEYLTFHDSDDWLHPRKIETHVDVMINEPNLVASFSNYFRVDENGNIIFRGKGAVRPACISLLIRRQLVMDKIGYFDSVRVSADSEYQYRIISVFGEENVSHLPQPMLIASVRSESLSQGGKFAVGWSGLSGTRLDYRQEYTKWHRSSDFLSNPYIDIKPETRRFPAPSEMMW